MNVKLIAAIMCSVISTHVYADTTQQVMQQQEVGKNAMDENKQKGEAFLKANKTQPGVIALANGLQ